LKFLLIKKDLLLITLAKSNYFIFKYSD